MDRLHIGQICRHDCRNAPIFSSMDTTFDDEIICEITAPEPKMVQKNIDVSDGRGSRGPQSTNVTKENHLPASSSFDVETTRFAYDPRTGEWLDSKLLPEALQDPADPQVPQLVGPNLYIKGDEYIVSEAESFSSSGSFNSRIRMWQKPLANRRVRHTGQKSFEDNVVPQYDVATQTEPSLTDCVRRHREDQISAKREENERIEMISADMQRVAEALGIFDSSVTREDVERATLKWSRTMFNFCRKNQEPQRQHGFHHFKVKGLTMTVAGPVEINFVSKTDLFPVFRKCFTGFMMHVGGAPPACIDARIKAAAKNTQIEPILASYVAQDLYSVISSNCQGVAVVVMTTMIAGESGGSGESLETAFKGKFEVSKSLQNSFMTCIAKLSTTHFLR